MISTLIYFLFAMIGIFQLTPEIISPRSGDVIQGTLRIIGTSDVERFQSSEISIAYSDDPTNTWFLLSQSDQPVRNDTLGEWVSTGVTDGNYSLRMRITLDDQSTIDIIVINVRVRNYTPVETPTIIPLIPTEEKTDFIIPTPTPAPTFTSLAPNPAQLNSENVLSSMIYGAIIVVVLLLLLGMYLRIRR
jgi:hypothetical protein